MVSQYLINDIIIFGKDVSIDFIQCLFQEKENYFLFQRFIYIINKKIEQNNLNHLK